MNRKSFIGLVSLIGACLPFANKVRSEEKPFSVKKGFSISKKIFKTKTEYEIAVSVPPNFRKTLSSAYLTVTGDDGACDMNGDFFNFVGGVPVKFGVVGDKMVFKAKFRREQGYCFRIFEKSFPKDAPQNKMSKMVVSFHVYALDEDLFALSPFKGDMHIHSTNSDGKNKPVEVALKCFECGFDIQAISDHGRYYTSADMQKLFGKYPTSVKFLNAEECHFAYPHIHNLGGSESVSDYIRNHIPQYYARVEKIMKGISETLPFRVRKDIAKIEAEAEIVRKFGGIAVFNHPYWQKGDVKNMFYNQMPKQMWDAVCERKSFDAYEIVNYGCGDISISRAVANIAELRAKGLDFPFVGSSDAHMVEDQGFGYSVIFAKSNSWADIKDAILNKRSVAVAEFAYLDKTNSDRRARLVFGDDRYGRFAYFLFDEFYPHHDALVKEEGAILAAILNASDANPDIGKLKNVSEKSKAAYGSIKA